MRPFWVFFRYNGREWPVLVRAVDGAAAVDAAQLGNPELGAAVRFELWVPVVTALRSWGSRRAHQARDFDRGAAFRSVCADACEPEEEVF